jgi:hypothetical protein
MQVLQGMDSVMWTFAGPAVALLFLVGIGAMQMGNARSTEHGIARGCFWASALILAGAIHCSLIQQSPVTWVYVIIALISAIVIGLLLGKLLNWVNERDALNDSARNELIQRSVQCVIESSGLLILRLLKCNIDAFSKNDDVISLCVELQKRSHHLDTFGSYAGYIPKSDWLSFLRHLRTRTFHGDETESAVELLDVAEEWQQSHGYPKPTPP